MKKQINEIKRMQELAGINKINENQENFDLLSWAKQNKTELQQKLNQEAQFHDIEPIRIGEILKASEIVDDNSGNSVWLGDKESEGGIGVFIWESNKEGIDLGEFETGGEEGEFEIQGIKLKYGWMYS